MKIILPNSIIMGERQNGLHYKINLLYEDRLPLNNTTDFSIIKYDPQKFTPNYPHELIDSQFTRHQAVTGNRSTRISTRSKIYSVSALQNAVRFKVSNIYIVLIKKE